MNLIVKIKRLYDSRNCMYTKNSIIEQE